MDIALYVLQVVQSVRMINAYSARTDSILLEKVLVRETVKLSQPDVLNVQSLHVQHVMLDTHFQQVNVSRTVYLALDVSNVTHLQEVNVPSAYSQLLSI